MKKSLVAFTIILLNLCAFGSEIIKIKLYDGESLTGRLSLPPDSSNIKLLIVYVPGTGPNTYLNKRKVGNVEFNYFDLFAEEFNKRGIGLFTYNTRGVEIGDAPPSYDKVDQAKYAKYLPLNEAKDVETVVTYFKNEDRFKNSKFALLGWSEGTIIASMVADRKVVKIDALLLAGYANDNLFDIIKWQFSGKSSIVNIRKYFDTNHDNIISKNEYESEETAASYFRTNVFKNADFSLMDVNKDSIIDYRDFKIKNEGFYKKLLAEIDSSNDSWIWSNYFRVTSKWLQTHFHLEANKTRLMRISIPIYIFHGADDGNVPVEGVYDIQSRFKKANKTNLHCYIFKEHDHDLNYLEWPFKKKISEGLTAIFNTAESLIK